MIDQGIFRNEWAILEDRFNRKFSRPVQARFFQILNERMNTEAFRFACQVAFAECEFFPTPEQLAAFSATEELGLDQWELCLRIMEGEPEIFDRMTESGKRTVKALGGYEHLRNTRLESIPFVRKEFLAIYAERLQGQERGNLIGPEVTPASRQIVSEVMGQLPPATDQ